MLMDSIFCNCFPLCLDFMCGFLLQNESNKTNLTLCIVYMWRVLIVTSSFTSSYSIELYSEKHIDDDGWHQKITRAPRHVQKRHLTETYSHLLSTTPINDASMIRATEVKDWIRKLVFVDEFSAFWIYTVDSILLTAPLRNDSLSDDIGWNFHLSLFVRLSLPLSCGRPLWTTPNTWKLYFASEMLPARAESEFYIEIR